MSEGKLYVMVRDDGAIKIGRSINPAKRRNQLGSRMKLVYESGVIADIKVVERRAHEVMCLKGEQLWGEWFRGAPEAAIEAIETAQKQHAGAELELVGRYKPNKKGPIGERKVFSVRDPGGRLRKKLDILRRRESDLPSRAEMLRRLVVREKEKRVQQEASE